MATAWFRAFAVLVWVVLWMTCCVSLRPACGDTRTTYYVDSILGDDSNSGKQPGRAWKTLDRVNAETFAPGSRILFKAGTSYTGCLRPRGSGAPANTNSIGKYGKGPKPQILAGSGSEPAVLLDNVECWEVTSLDIGGGCLGVHVRLHDYGPARNLRLRDLTIRGIQGGTTGDTGGILCSFSGETTIFDGLLIEGCTIERVDRNGILVTDYPNATNKHRSLGVVIRNNKLTDIGGDGIFILACKNAVIERNVVRYAHQRVGRGPGERACAGIWPQRSENTLVQLNEVSHTAVGGLTVWDSEAFDDDISCTGTVFQYNYSHDNAGGFMLVCGGRGSIVRYNISQNDGTATFTFESDGAKDSTIYNNTVYVREGLDVQLVRNTFGSPRGLRFLNNIFCIKGRASLTLGSIRSISFDHNAHFGSTPAGLDDKHAITADPMLVRPGNGANGFRSLGGYKLRDSSPCIGAGVAVPGNGGRDFWGNALSRTVPPGIGACNH